MKVDATYGPAIGNIEFGEKLEDLTKPLIIKHGEMLVSKKALAYMEANEGPNSQPVINKHGISNMMSNTVCYKQYKLY